MAKWAYFIRRESGKRKKVVDQLLGEMSLQWSSISILIIRPLLAVSFSASLIIFSWWLAWKTVLVHVPLVQEVFGLRKKPVRPRAPASHRFSRFYGNAASRNPDNNYHEPSSKKKMCPRFILNILGFSSACVDIWARKNYCG